MAEFSDSNVIPGGVYSNWDEQLIWIHTASDALNAVACLLIPIIFLTMLARRRDIIPMWVGILLCLPAIFSGLTYVLMAVQLWYPSGLLSAVTKAVGSLASLVIVGMLIRLRPRLLKLPNPREAIHYERKIGRMYRFLRPIVGRRDDVPTDKAAGSEVDQVGRYIRELAVAKRELEQSNAAQTRFLANMSHEIRTPLAGIMGYADQLLFDSSLGDRHRVSAESIKRCSVHLHFLLNDILDVANIEAGKLVIQQERCHLMMILHDVVTIMHGKFQTKPVDLKLVFDSPIPNLVVTDPLRLRQILLNLLGNAEKFTDKGQIVMKLKARGFENSHQGFLDIVVIDSGCGIPLEFQTRMFKRFSQAESASKMRNAGSGLGLFLAQTLARELGGDLVLLSSEMNQGTSFLFTLAVEILDDTLFVQNFNDFKPKADAPVKSNSIEGKLAGLSILVVEDGADNQRIFRHFLKMAGAEVFIVQDGPSALERALHDESIDLVLMDIQIPVMDGYEVTERLRNRGFTRPIIAVTAHSIHSERPLGAKVGISDFLAKPIQIENLIQTILQHAGQSQQEPAKETAAPQAEVWDRNPQDSEPHLLSKYHNNHLYREIIVAFVKSFQQRIEDIQMMINDMDWEKLGFALHQMKGAAATYGFPQVSEIAAQMEHTAKEARRDVHAVQTIRKQAEHMRGMAIRMQSGLSGAENRTV